MPEYRCLKKELFFKNHMFKYGDVYEGEPPKCGKGTDLTTGDKPAFRLIPGTEPEPEKDEKPQDDDPRSDAQIREDIWTIYGDKVHPNMKRSNLLAKEKLLKNLKGKDAMMAETEEI